MGILWIFVTWSMASWPMRRAVVHFPPRMETKPFGAESMICFRESLAVFLTPAFETSGRRPAKVAVICEVSSGKARWASSVMKSISCWVGSGWRMG